MNSLLKYILIAVIFFAFSAKAQYLSTLGRFEVDEIKGCAPFTVNINNILGAACPCDVRFGDGTAGANLFSHTYTVPGTYFIEIDYQSQVPRTDAIQITVVDNTLPSFEIQTCSGNQVTVKITDTTYDQFVVDFQNDGIEENIVGRGNPVPSHQYPGNGSFNISVRGRYLSAADNCNSEVKTVQAVTTLSTTEIQSVEVIDKTTFDLQYTPLPNTVLRLEISPTPTSGFQFIQALDGTGIATVSNSSLDLENRTYCLRVASFDACNGSSLYSPQICTVKANLTIGDLVNSLNWEDQSNTGNYSIQRDDGQNFSTTLMQYDDTQIICETDYCYSVTANYGSGATSTSGSVCGRSFSTRTPPRLKSVATSVSENLITLNWLEQFVYRANEFEIKRVETSGKLVDIGVFNSRFLEDSPATINGSICYNIGYTDVCGNASEKTDQYCTLYLTHRLESDNSVTLNWNAYNGYISGVSTYRIHKYGPDGSLVGTFYTNGTQYNDASDLLTFQVATYEVFAEPADLTDGESDSNEVTVIKKAIVSRPRAFTPDGDGLNDTFVLAGTFIESIQLRIYNRWGEIIFSSDEISTGWDGTYKGKLLPSGSFAWTADLKDQAGNAWQFNGVVALIRK